MKEKVLVLLGALRRAHLVEALYDQQTRFIPRGIQLMSTAWTIM